MIMEREITDDWFPTQPDLEIDGMINDFTGIPYPALKGNAGDGLYTTFYTNGQKRVEGHFVKHRMDGKWTEWLESGEKLKEVNYKS